MSIQEHEAIVALRGRDIAGLEAIVQLHQVRALRTAFMLTRDRQMAEDIVADAFLTVYDRIGQYDPRRPFEPWFYRIVVTKALMVLRRTGHQRRHTDSEDMLAGQVDPTPGPEASVVLRETRLLVQDIVRALPPPQRAAIVLRYYLDMDERAIAQTLGCPRGTVKWRLHAARARLRQGLAHLDGVAGRYGYDISEGEAQ